MIYYSGLLNTNRLILMLITTKYILLVVNTYEKYFENWELLETINDFFLIGLVCIALGGSGRYIELYSTEVYIVFGQNHVSSFSEHMTVLMYI